MPPARLHGLFSVRTRLLAEIAKWACQEDVRPHIARVLFDGKHMIATDGHRMVVAPLETGIPPFMLDREDCALLCAAQREIKYSRDADLVFVTVSEGKATIDLDAGREGAVRSGDRVVTVRARAAGDFPPWEAVFKGIGPQTPAPPEYIFNPKYLAAVQGVIEAADDPGRGVRIKAWTGIEESGYCGPMMFESAGGIRFLVMAMRAA